MALLEAEVHDMKAEMDEEINALKDEADQLAADLDQAHHTIKTKDTMLEDKNQEIGSLKAALADKDDEIRYQQEENDTRAQKTYFEGKLEEEYQQYQKLLDKNTDLGDRLVALEDEYDQLKADYEN